jgi:hypothetical protein
VPKWLTAALGAVLVLVLVAVGVVGGLRWWRDTHRTDLQDAVARAPHGSVRLSWTDWAGVRRELGSDVDADSSADEVSGFLSDGFDADLTSTSALVQSAPLLQERFGFSPASVDWELFSQGDTGAVVMLHVPSSYDFDALADRLARRGYAEPSTDTGVWRGGNDVLARIGALGDGLTPELAYFALDADDGLVLASDTADFLRSAVADATGDGGGVASVEDVVDASREPHSSAIYTGDYACEALAMGSADETDQEQADELVAAAGKVNPLTGFAMATQPGGVVRVAMSFESDDQARTNADTRAELARGPAPGQGGDFSDRFTLGDVEADGSVVTMALKPVEGQFVLSDLSTGPVLFATC